MPAKSYSRVITIWTSPKGVTVTIQRRGLGNGQIKRRMYPASKLSNRTRILIEDIFNHIKVKSVILTRDGVMLMGSVPDTLRVTS